MKQAIINAIIHTGDEILNDMVVISQNGIITSVQKEVPADADLIDLKGKHISSGFIDVQINGGEKFFFSQNPTEETVKDIYESSLKYGTTYILPCLISAPNETIFRAIETIRKYKQKHNNGVLGMHLEGPFLNHLKRGAHSPESVRKPTNSELEEIIRHGKDVIKIITIAPECFTDQQLDMLLASGIALSLGHTAVTYEQAQHYFSKGIKLVTHLYNGMTQFGHREPGLVGAVLENDTVYAPIVMDGAHCNYAAARIAYKLKKDKLFLISDATFLGQKIQDFKWECFNAQLQNGFYRNKDGNLAGSSISMVDAIKNTQKHLDISVDEAIKMATCRPAAAINMDAEIGKIKEGYPARFVSFNDDFTQINTL